MIEPQRPDDRQFIEALLTPGIRGLFSAHLNKVGIAMDRIVDFVDRSKSDNWFRTNGQGAVIASTRTGVHLADFSNNGSCFVHEYVGAYSRAWAIGCVFATHESDSAQSLLSADGIDIVATARGREIVVAYCGTARITVPVELGTITSIFCGYTGNKLRVWKDREPLVETEAITTVRPKSQLRLGEHRNGAHAWKGYIGEVAVYSRYEPAHNSDILSILNDYISFLYKI